MMNGKGELNKEVLQHMRVRSSIEARGFNTSFNRNWVAIKIRK